MTQCVNHILHHEMQSDLSIEGKRQSVHRRRNRLNMYCALSNSINNYSLFTNKKTRKSLIRRAISWYGFIQVHLVLNISSAYSTTLFEKRTTQCHGEICTSFQRWFQSHSRRNLMNPTRACCGFKELQWAWFVCKTWRGTRRRRMVNPSLIVQLLPRSGSLHRGWQYRHWTKQLACQRSAY